MYIGLTKIDQSKIQIPMVVYQGLQILFASLSTIAFRRWVRPEEEDDKLRQSSESHHQTSMLLKLQKIHEGILDIWVSFEWAVATELARDPGENLRQYHIVL